MSDLTLSPAAAELADSLADVSANTPYEPGKFGSPIPFMLAGMSASGAAMLVEGIVTEYLGDTAKALIESQHAAIAAFVSPRLADLAADIISEFGSKAK